MFQFSRTPWSVFCWWDWIGISTSARQMLLNWLISWSEEQLISMLKVCVFRENWMNVCPLIFYQLTEPHQTKLHCNTNSVITLSVTWFINLAELWTQLQYNNLVIIRWFLLWSEDIIVRRSVVSTFLKWFQFPCMLTVATTSERLLEIAVVVLLLWKRLASEFKQYEAQLVLIWVTILGIPGPILWSCTLATPNNGLFDCLVLFSC